MDVVWWGAEVTAEWLVGAVCLGSQYIALLDMVEGLLFQEYPSIVQVVSHCTSDTSAGPGLGSSVPATRVSSQGSGSFLVEGQGQSWVCLGPGCMLPRFSRFSLSNFIQAADHPCVGEALVAGSQGVWSPGRIHSQCNDVYWLKKASGWDGSSGVQVSTLVRIQKILISIHPLGGREIVCVGGDLASFCQFDVWHLNLVVETLHCPPPLFLGIF